MQILINASNLVKGGGIQVGDSVIREAARREDFRGVAVVSSVLMKLLDDIDIKSPDFQLVEYNIKANVWNAVFNHNVFLDQIVSQNNIDAVFSIFGPTYWRPQVPHLCGFAKPHYVYSKFDSPYFAKSKISKRIKIFLMKVFHLYSWKHSCDCFATETDDIRDRLQKICSKQKVYIVSNCCNQIFDCPKLQEQYKLPQFDGITLLTVAAYYPHKNLDILIKTAKYLKDKHPEFHCRFVLTVKKEDLDIPKKLQQYFLCIGLQPLKYVPSLYQQCDMMILPTLLECFSASYVEAMKSKVPILTSNLDFAKCVCGNAAIYFNPLDEQDIGEKIYKLANDKSLCHDLINEGQKRLPAFPNASQRFDAYCDILQQI